MPADLRQAALTVRAAESLARFSPPEKAAGKLAAALHELAKRLETEAAQAAERET